MPRTVLGEDIDAREFSETVDGEIKAQQTFLVKSDVHNDDPQLIRALPGVAQLYDFWGSRGDGGLDIHQDVLCVDSKANQDADSPWLWSVVCQFSNRIPANRTFIDYNFETYNEALQHDLFGTSIKNTAGFPYEPPMEVERGRLVITLTEKRRTFSRILAEQFMYAVNSEPWFGFDPGQCLMADIRAKDLQERGLPGPNFTWADALNYEVTWVIKVAYPWVQGPDRRRNVDKNNLDPPSPPASLATATGWQKVILNAGYDQRLPSGKTQQITTRSGTPTQPWPLQASGEMFPEGDTTSPRIWNVYTIYHQDNFNIWGIPRIGP